MSHIVANLVIRNEADQWLRPVLERILTQVDMVCVTDDASDDDSADIAQSLGAKVQRMKEPTFTTNEGALRQRSWDFLQTNIPHGEDWWVLAIDADEMLYETTHKMRDLIDQQMFDVLSIEFYHMWSETQFRIDKAWHPHPSSRLFRYKTNGQFQKKALACGSEPTYVMEAIRIGKYLRNTGLIMKHLSYSTEEGKQSKYARYASIDGGKFHANAHIESILDPNPTLFKWNVPENE